MSSASFVPPTAALRCCPRGTAEAADLAFPTTRAPFVRYAEVTGHGSRP